MNWIDNLKYTPEYHRKAVLQFVIILGSLFSATIQAQQTKNLEGRVFSKDGDVAGTHVMNISSQKATITDAEGFFSVQVRLNDTLVFSAIQYRRKVVPISAKLLESRFLNIYLEEGRIKLDEVFLTPYNLTGDLTKDLDSLKIGSKVTASSLGLPNANVKVKTQNERKLFEADDGKYVRLTYDTLTLRPSLSINLNKILNRINGRTQMFKKRIEKEEQDRAIHILRGYYSDSLLALELGVPRDRIIDFVNFCEVDSTFQSTLELNDRLIFWEYMLKKSVVYRKNNNLE